MERLVLVHGSVAGAASTWATQGPLAERFELVLVERPGFPPGPPVERGKFAIWLFLVDPSGHDPLSIDDGSYYLAVWARALTVVALMALVVRDILRPERDLVRRDGVDDPSGGVFDGAEDRLRIRLGATTRSDSPLHV